MNDVTFNILDGQLGQVPASVAGASVKLGTCSDGTVGTIYSFGDTTSLSSSLGAGPMVEALADTLTVAGGPCYALPLEPSSYGSAGSVTQTGTGTPVPTVTLAPKVSIAVKITTGGALGTAYIAFSVNGGAYSTPQVTVAGPGSYRVPGTLTTVTLAAGTYTLNDIYTISTLGAVTLTGSGLAASNVTHSDSPIDVYSVKLLMVVGGAVGTSTFKYSVDGGQTYSADIATAAKYQLPGTGVVINWTAGTYVAADTYSFTTTGPGYGTSDVTAAFTTLLGDSREWGFVHLVGAASSAANAATMASLLDTKMTTAETAYRFVFAVMECPTSESDSTVSAAFTSFQSKRVVVCAGDFAHLSPLTGKTQRRNAAWLVATRLASIQPGEDAAWVGRGTLKNINTSIGIYRDEAKTPLLDAARFTTLRTYAGYSGYYITQARTMAAAGSDFMYVVARRVMDVACRITRQAELPYLNGALRVTDTGAIDERDALSFEGDVRSKLLAGVVNTGDASAASVVVNRTANILSTSTLPVSVRVTPKGYARNIETSIGFNNPALPVAA